MRTFRALVILVAVLAAVLFLALPPIVETLGLHPHYAGERFELRGGRALIHPAEVQDAGDSVAVHPPCHQGHHQGRDGHPPRQGADDERAYFRVAFFLWRVRHAFRDTVSGSPL